MAGMYRNVFGISEVKGLRENDFKFIPNKPTAKVTGAEVSQQQVDVAAAVRWVEAGISCGVVCAGVLCCAGMKSLYSCNRKL